MKSKRNIVSLILTAGLSVISISSSMAMNNHGNENNNHENNNSNFNLFKKTNTTLQKKTLASKSKDSNIKKTSVQSLVSGNTPNMNLQTNQLNNNLNNNSMYLNPMFNQVKQVGIINPPIIPMQNQTNHLNNNLNNNSVYPNQTFNQMKQVGIINPPIIPMQNQTNHLNNNLNNNSMYPNQTFNQMKQVGIINPPIIPMQNQTNHLNNSLNNNSVYPNQTFNQMKQVGIINPPIIPMQSQPNHLNNNLNNNSMCPNQEIVAGSEENETKEINKIPKLRSKPMFNQMRQVGIINPLDLTNIPKLQGQQVLAIHPNNQMKISKNNLNNQMDIEESEEYENIPKKVDSLPKTNQDKIKQLNDLLQDENRLIEGKIKFGRDTEKIKEKECIIEGLMKEQLNRECLFKQGKSEPSYKQRKIETNEFYKKFDPSKKYSAVTKKIVCPLKPGNWKEISRNKLDKSAKEILKNHPELEYFRITTAPDHSNDGLYIPRSELKNKFYCSCCGAIGPDDKRCIGCLRDSVWNNGNILLENVNKERLTTNRFGICPNNKGKNPHVGFIHDERIRTVGTYFSWDREDLKNMADYFWFYCYNCKKYFLISTEVLGN